MKPEKMPSFDPEMERCRKVRAAIDSQYKSVGEAFDRMGEISDAKHKNKSVRPAKRSAAKVQAKRKLSA